MPTLLLVAPPDALRPGESRLVEHDGRGIAVFHVDGRYYAIEDTCPHRRGPLHEGFLDGCLLTCPWHGWQFDVRDGSCTIAGTRRVVTFPVIVDERGVFVSVPGPDEAPVL